MVKKYQWYTYLKPTFQRSVYYWHYHVHRWIVRQSYITMIYICIMYRVSCVIFTVLTFLRVLMSPSQHPTMTWHTAIIMTTCHSVSPSAGGTCLCQWALRGKKEHGCQSARQPEGRRSYLIMVNTYNIHTTHSSVSKLQNGHMDIQNIAHENTCLHI